MLWNEVEWRVVLESFLEPQLKLSLFKELTSNNKIIKWKMNYGKEQTTMRLWIINFYWFSSSNPWWHHIIRISAFSVLLFMSWKIEFAMEKFIIVIIIRYSCTWNILACLCVVLPTNTTFDDIFVSSQNESKWHL